MNASPSDLERRDCGGPRGASECERRACSRTQHRCLRAYRENRFERIRKKWRHVSISLLLSGWLGLNCELVAILYLKSTQVRVPKQETDQRVLCVEDGPGTIEEHSAA